MREKIHPKLTEVTVTCSCGHTIQTRSTIGKDFHVDVCSSCHSFFTGTQRIVDTAGNIEKFNRRYSNLQKKK